MYTATIKNKTIADGLISVEVEFTDGTTTVAETVKPASFDNLKSWVSNRLSALDSAKEIDATHTIGETIVTTNTPTQAELDREAWLKDYYRWIKVKTTLIDTQILIGNEAAVVALQTKVKNGFKAGYLDFI
jgi:hypothetical protein